jgi:hypothetical protein
MQPSPHAGEHCCSRHSTMQQGQHTEVSAVAKVWLSCCSCCCLCCSCCSHLDGLGVRSAGNSQALKETALVEAFNLKAAIEMMTKNTPAAAEALADMPPRYAVWSVVPNSAVRSNERRAVCCTEGSVCSIKQLYVVASSLHASTELEQLCW